MRQEAELIVARLFRSGQWLVHGRDMRHVGILAAMRAEVEGLNMP